MINYEANLNWKLLQGNRWISVSARLPASSAARVGCILLREFAGCRLTPPDLDITQEAKQFVYRSGRMSLHLNRMTPGVR